MYILQVDCFLLEAKINNSVCVDRYVCVCVRVCACVRACVLARACVYDNQRISPYIVLYCQTPKHGEIGLIFESNDNFLKRLTVCACSYTYTRTCKSMHALHKCYCKQRIVNDQTTRFLQAILNK